MKARALLVALLSSLVMLAGCASDDGETPDGPVDPGTFQLASGKGAISGLLVDDRFRPIQLTDDPQTEFQADGFILLQETGQQTQTTENGEFSFVDLDPGTYTLRFSVTDHEATPQRVDVRPDIFNEVSVMARRVLSEGSTIVSQEYTIFAGCPMELLVVSFANPWCMGDFSNDAGRFDFETNLSALQNDVTAMVTEARFSREGYFGVTIRNIEGCPENWCVFADIDTDNEDYAWFLMRPGEFWEDADGDPAPYAFDLSRMFQTAVFPHADITYPIMAPVTGPACAATIGAAGLGCGAVGTGLALKAKFLQSVFLGEPEVDLESFCVLC